MRKLITFLLLTLSTIGYGQDWIYEIEPMYKIDTKSSMYNDTADRLLIRLIQNAKDSVQVYYRVYNSRTGKDYVTPANQWFAYDAFKLLVLNDINALNTLVFSEFDLVAIKQED